MVTKKEKEIGDMIEKNVDFDSIVHSSPNILRNPVNIRTNVIHALEEIGLVAFDMIGNKRTRLYRASLEVGEDGSAALPCNCDIIEAVTYCGPEDWSYTSNIHEYGDIQSSYTENYIEGQKTFLDPLY